LKKNDSFAPPIPSDFRQQLVAILPEMAAASYERADHLSLFDADGTPHPPWNYASIAETLTKFRADFLPLCPLRDPRGRKIQVRANNFPKFLNLKPKNAATLKSAGTILTDIADGAFVEEDYNWEEDRLQSIFWIPDVIKDPDAIYTKKKGFGLVAAEEIYVKVYKKQNVGSPVKVLFTQRVGRPPKQEWIVISSYFTSRSTAKAYTDGEPLYRRPSAIASESK
jgi:hypothetical protein